MVCELYIHRAGFFFLKKDALLMETKNHNAIDYYIDVEPVLTSEARLHHTVCESVLKNVDHLDLRKVAPGCARKLSPSDNVTFF